MTFIRESEDFPEAKIVVFRLDSGAYTPGPLPDEFWLSAGADPAVDAVQAAVEEEIRGPLEADAIIGV